MKKHLLTLTVSVSSLCPHGEDADCCAACDDSTEPVLCEHGYPEGRGCQECEFWERAMSSSATGTGSTNRPMKPECGLYVIAQ